jgi:hypothetical protein
VPNLPLRTARPGGAPTLPGGGAGARLAAVAGLVIRAGGGWGVQPRARATEAPRGAKPGAARLYPPPCPSSVKIKSKPERLSPRPARRHQAHGAATLPCMEAMTWRS